MASSRAFLYRFLAVCIAIALGLALALQYWRGPSKSSSQIRAIVVLPLRNLSGDATQQYLADGMTEKLISDLGQISALRVISRTTSMSLKSGENRYLEIARELGVDGVIDGSMVRHGNEIRVTAQLTDARTGRHIWRQDYVRNLAGALDLQSEVAREIAEKIRIRVTPQEQARLTPAQPINLEAQDLYLQGIYFLNRGGSDQETIGYFEKAIEKDPSFALAYAGLAANYNAGQRAKANQTVSTLKDYVQKRGVGTYEIALVYAGLGNKDEAFAWLEKSYKARDKGLTYLKLDPCVDPLRSDPRFQHLLRRVGLTN